MDGAQLLLHSPGVQDLLLNNNLIEELPQELAALVSLKVSKQASNQPTHRNPLVYVLQPINLWT